MTPEEAKAKRLAALAKLGEEAEPDSAEAVLQALLSQCDPVPKNQPRIAFDEYLPKAPPRR